MPSDPAQLQTNLREWLATQVDLSLASVVVSSSWELARLPRETASHEFPGYEWLIVTQGSELVVQAGIAARPAADEFAFVAFWTEGGVACGQETTWWRESPGRWSLLAHGPIERADKL